MTGLESYCTNISRSFVIKQHWSPLWSKCCWYPASFLTLNIWCDAVQQQSHISAPTLEAQRADWRHPCHKFTRSRPQMNVGFIDEPFPIKEALMNRDQGQKMRWHHLTSDLEDNSEKWMTFREAEEFVHRWRLSKRSWVFPPACHFFLSGSFTETSLNEKHLQLRREPAQPVTHSCCLNSRRVKRMPGQSTLLQACCHGNKVPH